LYSRKMTNSLTKADIPSALLIAASSVGSWSARKAR
jgi:hypothetical protein